MCRRSTALSDELPSNELVSRARTLGFTLSPENAVQGVSRLSLNSPHAGGIMKCDVIASGIVNAAREVGMKVPLIVRLEGTNVQRGKEIIESSGLTIITADDLDDAAHKAVVSLSH